MIAILGVLMMGFGFISAVDADKPPFMPPDYYAVPGYPDANNANGRIFPGYVYDETEGPWNIFEQSDASFILQGWAYVVCDLYDETELFPQPIRFHVWIKPADSGDDAWREVELTRHAFGHGLLGEPDDTLPSGSEFVGPAFRWYAYFEPFTWAPGVYETHMTYTCKNPNNPKDKEMIVWDPNYGDEPLDYYGMFMVIDG